MKRRPSVCELCAGTGLVVLHMDEPDEHGATEASFYCQCNPAFTGDRSIKWEPAK